MSNVNDAYRPKSFAEFIGQDRIKSYLTDKITGCRTLGQPLGHLLFLGMSGTGKTTLSRLVASAMGVPFVEVFAPDLNNSDDILRILLGFRSYSVLFIDEIHDMSRKAQESMYRVLESFTCDYVDSRDHQRKTRQMMPFTLIGATTHEGALMPAFLGRIEDKQTLTSYTQSQLCEMLRGASRRKYRCELPTDVAWKLAGLSQMVSRQAYALMDQFMQMAMRYGLQMQALEVLLHGKELDPFLGLDRSMRQYLLILARKNGKPIGAESMATLLHKQEATLKNHMEPLLLSEELQIPLYEEGSAPLLENPGRIVWGPLAENTGRGRIITEAGMQYLIMCRQAQAQGWIVGERLEW